MVVNRRSYCEIVAKRVSVCVFRKEAESQEANFRYFPGRCLTGMSMRANRVRQQYQQYLAQLADKAHRRSPASGAFGFKVVCRPLREEQYTKNKNKKD